mmetsp:Transcript_8649/g.12213  ORF Transcript_8649/g.12213 Transcript_8649/m.12213 type:complete len:93 (-) Transcript_8649:6-284(-)
MSSQRFGIEEKDAAASSTRFSFKIVEGIMLSPIYALAYACLYISLVVLQSSDFSHSLQLLSLILYTGCWLSEVINKIIKKGEILCEILVLVS